MYLSRQAAELHYLPALLTTKVKEEEDEEEEEGTNLDLTAGCPWQLVVEMPS